ncbi:hypothetical protein OH76DRAFT_193922 [Lentinus brumalis]|uniref:Uncharacterized protein n=1 Tax=Lentinus brumalis TaxID=2498619 RepID=A0A371DHW6_9APHY|nr:hypothetical protein OH76DRAFT_193922 [Polyporus brumalis]
MPSKTRSDNVDRYLGALDMSRTRRSSGAEVRADDAARKNVQRHKAKADKARQATVAQMERDLVENDQLVPGHRVKRARVTVGSRPTGVEDELEEELPRKQKGKGKRKASPVDETEVSSVEEEEEPESPGPAPAAHDDDDFSDGDDDLGDVSSADTDSTLTEVEDTPIATKCKKHALRTAIRAAKAGLPKEPPCAQAEPSIADRPRVKAARRLRRKPGTGNGQTEDVSRSVAGSKIVPSQDGIWKDVFVPTWLRYVGTTMDPWSMSDAEVVAALQKIWDQVYLHTAVHGFAVAVGDSVHGWAMQRVHKWRRSFSSNGLRAFDAWFKSKGHLYESSASKAAFCADIIGGGRLFYENPEEHAKTGLYRSPFVLAGLAAHIEATQGAVFVAGLGPTRKVWQAPLGALGLAAAAAYRAALLYAAEKVAGHGGNLTITKRVNAVSGKENKKTDLSNANFGGKTRQCVQSASGLRHSQLRSIWTPGAQALVLDTPVSVARAQAGAGEPDYSNLVDEEEDE